MGIRGARHGCRRSRLPPPRLSQAGGVDPRGVVAPRTTAGALVHEQGGGSGPPTLHTRAWVQGMGATVPRHRPSRSLHPPRRPPSHRRDAQAERLAPLSPPLPPLPHAPPVPTSAADPRPPPPSGQTAARRGSRRRRVIAGRMPPRVALEPVPKRKPGAARRAPKPALPLVDGAHVLVSARWGGGKSSGRPNQHKQNKNKAKARAGRRTTGRPTPSAHTHGAVSKPPTRRFHPQKGASGGHAPGRLPMGVTAARQRPLVPTRVGARGADRRRPHSVARAPTHRLPDSPKQLAHIGHACGRAPSWTVRSCFLQTRGVGEGVSHTWRAHQHGHSKWEKVG